MEAKRNFYDLNEIWSEVLDKRVSKSYIYVLAREGRLPTVRFGRKILVPAEAVAKLLGEGIRTND